MYRDFHPTKLYFLIILMVFALLSACTTSGYYAPVITYNNKFAGDKLKPLTGKQRLDQGSRGMRTQQTATNPRAFHSLDKSSGHGYQRPPPPAVNNISVRTKRSAIKKKDTARKQQNKAVKNTSTRQTISTNSTTDNPNSKDSSAHKKKPTKPRVVTQTKSQRKKSIVSIDNKKMLELSFVWPIKGRVLKKFSPSHNKGIDIAGKNGQLVKATEAGKVVYGGQGLIGFGKLLIIKHNDVYLSAYANNSRLLIKEGQRVKKGQVVAQVGKVGSKRTSLHFEIRKNGKPVNPLNLLPKK